ncbi:hypothetical protein AS29_004060 [Bacillus sp. SJS]|nr:RHS repeat-associated core domain-containing protein [Bacillus sp. SJS]KZZ85772.1 hypothetical protein AS29_004060 [Bacillus sp. SJS]
MAAQPKTAYTLSGSIKTNLLKSNAFMNVEFLNAQKSSIGWADNRYSQLKANQPWTDRQVSFTTPEGTSFVRVYLEVDHKDPTASGSALFDGMHLEKGEVSSSFNPVLNSSFESGAANWTGSGGSVDSTTGFDGSSSLKVVRTSTAQEVSLYKQTITIGQSAGSTPFSFTLTGLSKADQVNGTPGNGNYSLIAKVYYTDGTTGSYTANFPAGTQEWNRGAVTVPKSKPVDRVEVLSSFGGNTTGTAWFDAIRLIKGSVMTKSKYDAAGNYETETEDETGNKTIMQYDSFGNAVKETNPKGYSKSFTYDLSNQLKKLLLQNGTDVSYEYDANGNMLSKAITSSAGVKQTFSYQYDELGQLLETKGPLQDVTSNEYDPNGNKVKTTLPNGTMVNWTYDGTNRVKSIGYNGTPVYDYSYDRNGNELSVKDLATGGTKTRTFDKANRVTALTDRGSSQTWTYPTETDKLKSFQFTHGGFNQTNTFEYNQKDQNTAVKDGTSAYRFDYDEQGNVGTFITGNGAGASFQYDSTGLVQQIHVGLKDGTSVLSETYSYDANGNRTKIESGNGSNVQYQYDELDQLTKETYSNGTVKEYSYDGFGNRISTKETSGGQTTTVDAQYNLANQLTRFGSEALSYDLNGNRTEDGRYQYTWDSRDQLTAVTKKGESQPFATYKYNEDGKRIQKTVNGTVTNYFYDGDSLNVLYETNSSNQVIRSYTYSEGGQLLSMKKGSNQYFYHYNARGDVIALTDAQSNVVASYEYDAWGNVLKEVEQDSVKDNPYRYVGYQYDKETGMYYLIARYYEPKHGVFLALDPYPGDDNDLLTQNGYTYAINNPVMMFDPDGNIAVAIPLVLLADAAVIGTAVAINYAFSSNGPIGKANRKKQGREVNEKKRGGKNFKSRSNKSSNRDMKKHTPGRGHKKGKK